MAAVRKWRVDVVANIYQAEAVTSGRWTGAMDGQVGPVCRNKMGHLHGGACHVWAQQQQVDLLPPSDVTGWRAGCVDLC